MGTGNSYPGYVRCVAANIQLGNVIFVQPE
jgi:hypothetical protein